jgi:hypothetical protein
VITPELVLQSIALYPGNVYLQREWVRAVLLVRSTHRGWLLEHPIPRDEPSPLYEPPRVIALTA